MQGGSFCRSRSFSPWKPNDHGPIDISTAVVFETPCDHERLFARGQWKEQTITVSNVGGIYVFEEDAWTMQLASDDQASSDGGPDRQD
jgi:hypothetical protein